MEIRGATKTIYVQPQDLETWKEALQLAEVEGKTMGVVIVEQLRQYIKRFKKCQCGVALKPSFEFCPACGRSAH